MSWIVPTGLMLLIGFAGFFALCEWFAGNRRPPGGGGRKPR